MITSLSTIFFILGFFVLGLCVGSFLNVVILRTHQQRPLIFSRSACGHCNRNLRAWELVPVVSFLALRGRCRTCQVKISWQYPIVELLTGLLFLLAYLLYPIYMPNLGLQAGTVLMARNLAFISLLIVLLVYDLRYMYILDKFTIPAIVLAFFWNWLLGMHLISSMALGGLMIGGFFWFQYVASKGRWVGGGDIRMGVLMGVMLGFANGLVALFLSYVFGAAVAAILLLTNRASRSTQLPFGVFLTIGTIVVLLTGDAIINWYLQVLV